MVDGFLGRWSQRKQAVREGKVLVEPIAQPTAVAPPQSQPAEAPAVALAAPTVEPAPVAPPPPTLDDVQHLTPESDFKPFVAREVAPEVRNAAMRKLFADPHFNVMDRLDIYIDDYSKPDPLPTSMLRQMASAKFLNLFEEEDKDQRAARVQDDAHSPTPQSMAQPTPALPPTGPEHLTENKPAEQGVDHDHTDLRLQPNDAAGPHEPGRSTE